MRDGFSELTSFISPILCIHSFGEVRSSRIITDETGAISEIHVVASSDRSPKMIARDVETALKAELGLEIDYRKIGVVMMDPVGRGDEEEKENPLEGEPLSADDLVDERFIEVEPEAAPEEIPEPFVDRRRVPEPPPEPVPLSLRAPLSEIPADGEDPDDAEPGLEFLEDSVRIEFRGLNLSLEEESIKAEVRLTSNGLEVIGCVEECCGNRPVIETVAGAAVKALVELLDENFHLCLSEVRELEITGRKALVAVVDMIRGRDSSSYSGCAFVGRDSGEAAVMAVLDAVNRPFGRWKSRREIHYRIR